jgi:hypothetical protein
MDFYLRDAPIDASSNTTAGRTVDVCIARVGAIASDQS